MAGEAARAKGSGGPSIRPVRCRFIVLACFARRMEGAGTELHSVANPVSTPSPSRPPPTCSTQCCSLEIACLMSKQCRGPQPWSVWICLSVICVFFRRPAQAMRRLHPRSACMDRHPSQAVDGLTPADHLHPVTSVATRPHSAPLPPRDYRSRPRGGRHPLTGSSSTWRMWPRHVLQRHPLRGAGYNGGYRRYVAQGEEGMEGMGYTDHVLVAWLALGACA